LNPPNDGIALFEAVAATTRKLHVEKTAGHYDMYDGLHFDSSIGKQIDWFHQHV
jgi:uncharacterized protein